MSEKVESSFINSIDWDPETKVLRVRVKGGKSYGYQNVPEEVFEEFRTADSHGKFFNTSIRGQFEPTKS